MCVGCENQEVRYFNICVGRGESQTYTVNQSLCQLERQNISFEKVACMWGGDSRVMQLPSKSRSKKFQTSCVILNDAGIAVDVFLSRSRSRLTFELSLTIL